MLQTSEAYKAAIDAPVRTILPFAEVRIVSPDIVYEGTEDTGHTVFSNPPQIHNGETQAGRKLITLEHNYWVLDGTAEIAPVGPETSEVGIVLDAMSDQDCNFSPAPWAQLDVSGLNILQGLTVYFSNRMEDGWPVDFTMSIHSGIAEVYTETVTGNKKTWVRFENFTAYMVTAVRVTVQKWSLPYRRPRILELLLGIQETWDSENLDGVDILVQSDFTNLTTVFDTVRLSIFNEDFRFDPNAKNSIFLSIEDRQAIKISYGVTLADGSVERAPVGVFYQSNGGWNTGATDSTFTFNLISIVGLINDRVPILPDPLPVTFEGWIALLVSTPGRNFEGHYIIDDSLRAAPIPKLLPDAVQGMTCGVLLRYLCMIVGGLYRSDPETGYLRIDSAAGVQGTRIGLRSQFTYPVQSANDDIADIQFTFTYYSIDQNNNVISASRSYTVAGTRTTASKSLKVSNPFILNELTADAAARNILSFYGGNRFQINGRGDMSCELGDIDSIETINGVNVSGRRYKQQLKITSGVMLDTPSYHVQAVGQLMYQNRIEFISSEIWTAPDGVTKLHIIIVGPGQDGQNGYDGQFPYGAFGLKPGTINYNGDGLGGLGGLGAQIYIATIDINPSQAFDIHIGADASTMGGYSSAYGVRYAAGYGDIYSGKVYGVAGMNGKSAFKWTGEPAYTVDGIPFWGDASPGTNAKPNTGNGGGGGNGGASGRRHVDPDNPIIVVGGINYANWIIDFLPINGGHGGKGATGAVIIYWDDPEDEQE